MAALDRPDLHDVTVLAVDTRSPQLAWAALKRCQDAADFGRVLLLSDQRPDWPLAGVDWGCIEHLDSAAAYSRFMIKGLLPWVETPFVLIAQWDGFIVNPQAWDPAFRHWDYLGAPWPQFKTGPRVGNGGFSWRSRRLLQALMAPQFEAAHPEDLWICRHWGPTLTREAGIRFAPEDLAQRFACERGGPLTSWGFHGLHRFGDVWADPALIPLLDTLPAAVFLGKDGKDLAKRLLDQGRLDAAQVVIARRQAAGLRDFRSKKLNWRLQGARLLQTWRVR